MIKTLLLSSMVKTKYKEDMPKLKGASLLKIYYCIMCILYFES